ncbi:MAG: PDZ domain-containing protein, partial [Planctomycetota bacterium]
AEAPFAHIYSEKRPSLLDNEVALLLRGRPKLRLGVKVSQNPNGGYYLQQVETGSIAERDGLRTGDLLRTVGGTEADNPWIVGRELSDREAGETLRFVVIRDGSQHEVNLLLEYGETKEDAQKVVGSYAKPVSRRAGGFWGSGDK